MIYAKLYYCARAISDWTTKIGNSLGTFVILECLFYSGSRKLFVILFGARVLSDCQQEPETLRASDWAI